MRARPKGVLVSAEWGKLSVEIAVELPAAGMTGLVEVNSREKAQHTQQQIWDNRKCS